jgi:hypothetical protein
MYVTRQGEAPSVDEGPLKAYLSVFPERELRWNAWRERWEIYQHNPVTQQYEWFTSLWEWRDIYDPETGTTRRVKGYRAFDRSYDADVALKWWRELENKGVKRLDEERYQRNKANARAIWDDVSWHTAEGFGELRRWIPVLAKWRSTGEWSPDERIPLVAGANLK